MTVTDAGDVLGRTGILHHRDTLGNQLAGTRPNDVDPQYAVGAGVGDYLHLPFRIAQAARPTVGQEGEATDAVLLPALLDLLLRPADRGNLRPGVDRAGDGIGIDERLPTGQALRHGNALVLRLVRQHRPFDDIAEGINPLNRRFPTFAENDSPRFLIDLHAGLLQAESRGMRTAA